MSSDLDCLRPLGRSAELKRKLLLTQLFACQADEDAAVLDDRLRRCFERLLLFGRPLQPYEARLDPAAGAAHLRRDVDHVGAGVQQLRCDLDRLSRADDLDP